MITKKQLEAKRMIDDRGLKREFDDYVLSHRGQSLFRLLEMFYDEVLTKEIKPYDETGEVKNESN